ncbi:MAG: threonine--tRNA ligase [Candidatus Lokiarchaeota archaeon]|nr:threonine--tRNA ligase [Candidatus Lokiarchaeota archaeon]
MRILTIHSDYLEVEPKKKAIKTAEDSSKEIIKTDDCLVCFISVEKNDEVNINLAAEKLVDNIIEWSNQLNEKNIVLYPYAHLSSELASPKFAIPILKNAEKILKEKGYSVTRTPFGWYKAFKISCKGHPLAESARTVSISIEDKKKIETKADEVSEALKKEDELTSSWFVLTPDGKEYPVEIVDGNIKGYDVKKKKNLGKLIGYEMKKDRKVDIEPPHVELMKKLEIANYEPASDPGNLRYLPKGNFIKSQICDYTTEMTSNYGAMMVETPIMYDLNHPTLHSYLNRFPARQYLVKTPNKDCFLRFAACFGQFLIAKDVYLTHKHLPLRLYELTKYSFRVEKRGELTGLRRLRCFTMPDCHAMCKDLDQVKSEMFKRFDLAKNTLEGCGLGLENFEFALRVVKDFYEDNKEFIMAFVKMIGKPILVEMWNQRFFYFIFKYEWNFIDALGKASTLATDQIDVENAERYGITFMDENDEKKHPYIMHLSPTGAIERVVYALLEREHIQKEKGIKPQLSTWLSPTILRILPIKENHVEFAIKIMESMEKEGIRVDVDDRTYTIGKKIREAESEWIPYIIVIGDNEVENGGKSFNVRIRGEKVQKELSPQELINKIKSEITGKPNKGIPLPKLLSKRPNFI